MEIEAVLLKSKGQRDSSVRSTQRGVERMLSHTKGSGKNVKLLGPAKRQSVRQKEKQKVVKSEVADQRDSQS